MKKITFLLFTFCLTLFSFSQSTATYTITFVSVWNSSDHGTLPGGAHWSSLVGATHQTPDEFLTMGNTASPGIKDIAETGAFGTFQSEINSNADANQFISGGGLGSATGIITVNNLQVSEDFPLLTLASMIAPSPDWFIAVNSVNLRSGNNAINNGWKNTFSMDLFPYDAGTDDGSSYTASNAATMPQGVITNLSGVMPFNTNKIGTITFTYNTSTLSSEKTNVLNNLKIFPNPTESNITISSIQNIKLKNIEIYNVLGKLVKEISIKNNLSKLEINLSDLNRGIYLLNLTTVNGLNKTQKLVIN